MKGDVELMLKVASRAIDEGKKVYIEIRGDQEARGPIASLDRLFESGASLVCVAWTDGQTFCRPEDLVAVTLHNK